MFIVRLGYPCSHFQRVYRCKSSNNHIFLTRCSTGSSTGFPKILLPCDSFCIKCIFTLLFCCKLRQCICSGLAPCVFLGAYSVEHLKIKLSWWWGRDHSFETNKVMACSLIPSACFIYLSEHNPLPMRDPHDDCLLHILTIYWSGTYMCRYYDSITDVLKQAMKGSHVFEVASSEITLHVLQ